MGGMNQAANIRDDHMYKGWYCEKITFPQYKKLSGKII